MMCIVFIIIHGVIGFALGAWAVYRTAKKSEELDNLYKEEVSSEMITHYADWILSLEDKEEAKEEIAWLICLILDGNSKAESLKTMFVYLNSEQNKTSKMK